MLGLPQLLALVQAGGMILAQVQSARSALSSSDQATLDAELLKIHGKLDADIDRTLGKLDAAARR